MHAGEGGEEEGEEADAGGEGAAEQAPREFPHRCDEVLLRAGRVVIVFCDVDAEVDAETHNHGGADHGDDGEVDAEVAADAEHPYECEHDGGKWEQHFLEGAEDEVERGKDGGEGEHRDGCEVIHDDLEGGEVDHVVPGEAVRRVGEFAFEHVLYVVVHGAYAWGLGLCVCLDGHDACGVVVAQVGPVIDLFEPCFVGDAVVFLECL